MKKIVIVGIFIGIALMGGGYYWRSNGASPVEYRTATVKRGNIRASISATGTVEPEEVVDVGAQVAGQIEVFGRDPRDPSKTIDYGTEVEVGTILAKIDDSLYTADVDQAKAQLAQAKANEQRAQADLLQMKAKLEQTHRDWRRAEQLGPNQGVISGLDYDTTKAAYESAVSALAVGEAAITQAKSSVEQAQAALSKAQRNLGYCTIKSPVKGVIVDRRVNIGQTVVSSLNAPSLFLIAKDLRRMQVWASVNEADIGQIHPGQLVRFTVDAFPGTTFKGAVGKVRLNATMTQNVVTYTVEVITDNSSGKLVPYLTANLQFEVDRRDNVLLVPSAALRWTPSPERIAPDARDQQAPRRPVSQGAQSLPGRGPGGPGGGAAKPRDRADSAESERTGTLWVEDGIYVRPMFVRTGVTDGANTEVIGDNVSENMTVVVGEKSRQAAAQGTTNPFTPQLFNQRKGG
jgi:HlyD family secretion protein